MYGCFAFLDVCAPHVFLVPMEMGLQMTVSHHVESGSQTQLFSSSGRAAGVLLTAEPSHVSSLEVAMVYCSQPSEPCIIGFKQLYIKNIGKDFASV